MTSTRALRDRTRPPKLRAEGLERRFTAGRWVFRGRIEFHGRVLTGSWHEDQELAIEDRRKLVLEVRAAPPNVVILSDAMLRVIGDARARGLPERTIQCHYVSHARYLLRVFGDNTRVHELTVPRVQEWVREALETGRSPTTLIQKDLPLIDRACGLARVPSPVAEVKAIMRARLRVVRRPPRFLTADEIKILVDRMRNEEFLDANGHPLRIAGRHDDAALVEFVAATGVRAGELGRIPLSDVDLERGVIHVAAPKDHANPRDLVVPPGMVPVVERLVRRAQRIHAEGRNPRSLLVPNAMAWLGNLGRRWKARLDEPRLNGRTLRHSFVSGVVSAGATAAEARDLAGHTRLSTTDRYVHAVGASRSAAAARWTERLAADPAADS